MFWSSENLVNYSNPKQESDKCPLVCIFRCASQRLAYRRGHSLFILVSKVYQSRGTENKQKEVPRFFYNYTNGAFGANFPTKHSITMKKIHLLLLGLTICLFSACHNDIWDAIDGLDSRVTKLEELCKEMNTNITSLQTIVDVLQSNDFITSIVEIKKDGEVIGYTITFGKHDPITIYHGQDGKDGQNGQNGADGKDGQDGQNGADGKDGSTPVIGVAQDTDGVYYWTLNGEWLLDDNGNKLPVSGKDGQNGANGTMPQLKIEEGDWYVSYDNGVTWTQLGKATGEDGEKGEKGESGDSMFQSVTQDENYVYFTLADGTVIKIAKGYGANDQPNLEDIINFRDLAVKSALLKLGVDTTGDGEISYGEAALYSGTLSFANNTKIYSFKEFKYFTNIDSCNFVHCNNLFEIEIPLGLTKINDNAFQGCSSLSYILIPNNVTSIGENAFSGCTSLTSIDIPNGVTNIGENAFSGCISLTSICIPNSVTTIGHLAFGNCPNLTYFIFPENYLSETLPYSTEYIETIYWNTINFIGSFDDYQFINDYTSHTYHGLGHTYWESNYRYVFNYSITTIIFGNKVQSIPDQLCSGLKGLTEVIIPNSVIKIGDGAFEYTSLTTVTIPESVTEMGASVFYNSSLQTLYCKAPFPPSKSISFPNTIGIIYVPNESLEEYKALWSAYANKIVGYDFE